MSKSTSDFASDLAAYKHMGGVVTHLRPMLNDSEPEYSTDGHYNLMNRWAFQKIYRSGVVEHTDLASHVGLVTILSAIRVVNFVDLRDPGMSVASLRYIKGDLCALPFANGSEKSLSCLHVAEHIGLGRYGDKIDPDGFSKACREMVRVLAPGGNLYFAVPCGISSVVFNAHRVLAFHEVIEQFSSLRLESFTAMRSTGVYCEDAPDSFLNDDPYGVGMFHFSKEPACLN